MFLQVSAFSDVFRAQRQRCWGHTDPSVGPACATGERLDLRPVSSPARPWLYTVKTMGVLVITSSGDPPPTTPSPGCLTVPVSALLIKSSEPWSGRGEGPTLRSECVLETVLPHPLPVGVSGTRASLAAGRGRRGRPRECAVLAAKRGGALGLGVPPASRAACVWL